MHSPIFHWESSRSVSRVFGDVGSGTKGGFDLVSGRDVANGDGLVGGGGSARGGDGAG